MGIEIHDVRVFPTTEVVSNLLQQAAHRDVHDGDAKKIHPMVGSQMIDAMNLLNIRRTHQSNNL